MARIKIYEDQTVRIKLMGDYGPNGGGPDSIQCVGSEAVHPAVCSALSLTGNHDCRRLQAHLMLHRTADTPRLRIQHFTSDYACTYIDDNGTTFAQLQVQEGDSLSVNTEKQTAVRLGGTFQGRSIQVS